MTSLTINCFKPEWESFSLQSMPEINEYASFHRFKKGQVIFYSGHMPYGLFILISGAIDIKYGNNKTEKVTDPAFLGISVIKNSFPLSGTFKALSDCELYFLSFSVYKELKGTEHPLAKWIHKYIYGGKND